MSSNNREDGRDVSDTASRERLIILVASFGAILGGFFPWAQPLDLEIWGYDDGDGLITMASGIMTLLFVWLEWRQIAAGAAAVFGGFILFVAATNYTPDPGPGIIISAVSGAVIVIAGLVAVRRFGLYHGD